MAIAIRDSAIVTSLRQLPFVPPPAWLANLGLLFNASVVDNAGSLYRFGVLPSSVRLRDVMIKNDAAIGGLWQLGVYNNEQTSCTTVTGGVTSVTPPGQVPTVWSNLIFGSSITIPATQLTWRSIYTPQVLNNGTYTVANEGLRVWELLGLDKDPFYDFLLVLTCAVSPTASGNIALQWDTVR
jgi:hypothetical protein